MMQITNDDRDLKRFRAAVDRHRDAELAAAARRRRAIVRRAWLVVAACVTASAIMIPLAIGERGGWGFGAEWIPIAMIPYFVALVIYDNQGRLRK